jgi:prepilin-type N-terminal cleavage/methylation domain-containing protein
MGGKEMKSIIERLRRARQREDGFTLIELLIVILILGILAGIAILNSVPFQEKAAAACAEANVKINDIVDAATLAGIEGDLTSGGGCSGGPGGPGGPGGDAAPAGSVTVSNSGGTATANTSGVTGSPSPTFTFSWERDFSFGTGPCPTSDAGYSGSGWANSSSATQSGTQSFYCYQVDWEASNSEGSTSGTSNAVRGG